jgi:SAM-dependent methyltransferase
LMAEPGPRRGPGPLVRALDRAVNSAVARFLFDSVALGWDERVRSDSPEYLEPLVAALDRLEASPGRIPDIGTGTGAAALALADRYPDAEVVGIDISAEMVAKAKAADRSGPVPGRRQRELRRRGRVRPDRDIQHAAVVRPGHRPPEALTLRGQRQLLQLADALLHPAGAVGARLRAPGRPHGGRRASRPGHLLPRPTGVAGPAARRCADGRPLHKAVEGGRATQGRGIVAPRAGGFGTHASVLAPPPPASPCASFSASQYADSSVPGQRTSDSSSRLKGGGAPTSRFGAGSHHQRTVKARVHRAESTQRPFQGWLRSILDLRPDRNAEERLP